MPDAPTVPVDPFVGVVRGIDEPGASATLRAAGPIVQVAAPAGGLVWIITDDALARQALGDERLVKDPAFAPTSWQPLAAGLEPTAAQQVSLTTLDGPAHTALRRAHIPLLTARQVQAHGDRIATIARGLLGAAATADGPVDLTGDFTTRFPLAVVCEVLGAPTDRLDDAVAACRRMGTDDPTAFPATVGALMPLAAAALRGGDGVAAGLRERAPEGITESDLQYLVFGLVFAGQITTAAALGFLVARALGGVRPDGQPADEFVHDVLRHHPPAAFTLWRFTSTEMELGGVRLPERSPVLVDIAGINSAPRGQGADLTFGAGPHFCVGAQLAQLEMRVVVDVLATDFPDARLAVPYDALQRVDRGMHGSRLTALPVLLS